MLTILGTGCVLPRELEPRIAFLLLKRTTLKHSRFEPCRFGISLLCLAISSTAFDVFNHQTDLVWMVEVASEAKHVWTRKARIAMFLSAVFIGCTCPITWSETS